MLRGALTEGKERARRKDNSRFNLLGNENCAASERANERENEQREIASSSSPMDRGSLGLQIANREQGNREREGGDGLQFTTARKRIQHEERGKCSPSAIANLSRAWTVAAAEIEYELPLSSEQNYEPPQLRATSSSRSTACRDIVYGSAARRL